MFQALALIPILAPSLLPAISLIYLFGNQGFLKDLMFGASIYGPIGIVISQVFYCFPHAMMILVAALSMADSRLYEAADALGASKTRVFFTVTLPGAKYGVISAGFVVFTLVITDFGIAKVIGGRFNVLATDIFKQVIGQQNFEMGAVVGFVLLIPAVFAFAADRIIVRRQVALLSARAVPLIPKPAPKRDWGLFLFCAVVGGLILSLLAMAAWASFVTNWPYNLTLTLSKYEFGNFDTNGWAAYWNSVELASWTAVIGTVVVFLGAYLLEKTRGFAWGRGIAQLMAMLPMAVPGLVLGLAYIFFFNARWNPLGFIYATMIILVVNSVTHFYTVSHLTAATALKQLDHEFEAVSASLKVSLLRTMAQGDDTDLRARGAGHHDLPVRQRDDHGVGGDLPLFDQHQARRGLDHQHGRGRLHRGGRGHGDDHRRHVRRREDRARAVDAPARSHNPGLAPTLSAALSRRHGQP